MGMCVCLHIVLHLYQCRPNDDNKATEMVLTGIVHAHENGVTSLSVFWHFSIASRLGEDKTKVHHRGGG